jgi:hypothetical protein
VEEGEGCGEEYLVISERKCLQPASESYAALQKREIAIAEGA